MCQFAIICTQLALQCHSMSHSSVASGGTPLDWGPVATPNERTDPGLAISQLWLLLPQCAGHIVVLSRSCNPAFMFMALAISLGA
jgi:hypothetical protein